MIADFWMPDRSWPGCDVEGPSARMLSNYGASGEWPADDVFTFRLDKRRVMDYYSIASYPCDRP